MVPKSEILEWIASGKKQGHKYLIVACDTFDYEDYPIYLDSLKATDQKTEELKKESMADYHGIYDLSIDDYEESRKAYWRDHAKRIREMSIAIEPGKYGEWWLKGKIHHVWIQKRPDYCDRGHYIANVQEAPDLKPFTYSIDEADGWPRYYMNFDRMIEEIREWIKWREKDVTS